VDVTTIPFKRILDNILDAARLRPIVIQSLFMRLHGKPPAEGEIQGYYNRLREISYLVTIRNRSSVLTGRFIFLFRCSSGSACF
jgi:hypothetical protein